MIVKYQTLTYINIIFTAVNFYSLQLFFKIFLLLAFFFISAGKVAAQVTVSGTVYDATKRNYVENVLVQSTSGKFSISDTLGNYKIVATSNDSLVFIYQDKPTQKFAVAQIPDLQHFDISLHIKVKSKYNTLKEVVVVTKSYQQDSVENRELYADFYNYRKPTIRTGVSPDGAVGADLDEIINLFRFKRNKRLLAFRKRLEQQEQDKYVAWRFNKRFVGRITQLKGAELDSFMVRYLPTYEFASTADEVSFNRYILNSSYAFKFEQANKQQPENDAKKEN